MAIDRLAFYAGALAKTDRAVYQITDWAAGILAPTYLTRVAETERERYIPKKFGQHDGWLFLNYFDQIAPIVDQFAGRKLAFLLKHGDVTANTILPSFAKTRPVGSYGNSIILKLNTNRHWSQADFDEVKANDMPFAEKAKRVVWRGVSSGHWYADPKSRHSDYQSARFNLVLDWALANEDWVDVGLTKTTRQFDNPKSGYLPTGAVQKYRKPPVSIAEQLKSKYILVPEGKDVATGLKWALTSRSVVMMPKPTISSWLMEEKLEPWKHFIPVKKDFSDLREKFELANENPDLCESILDEANAYMRQFEDEAQEKALQTKLFEMYLERIKFKVAPGLGVRSFEALNVRWEKA
ncbi:glycosyl transferase family 90 [Methylopila turkensis]|uniref:LPS A protein n=1 Tax=Methylopila turkensis TaxID=1437816 RepID=A0A9W6N7L5_9HYPH|nr:glycosyl transferase family 90 [Methylopila turkensis]GLK80545.1 LPS A protein [Methylopila turkensis]